MVQYLFGDLFSMRQLIGLLGCTVRVLKIYILMKMAMCDNPVFTVEGRYQTKLKARHFKASTIINKIVKFLDPLQHNGENQQAEDTGLAGIKSKEIECIVGGTYQTAKMFRRPARAWKMERKPPAQQNPTISMRKLAKKKKKKADITIRKAVNDLDVLCPADIVICCRTGPRSTGRQRERCCSAG